MSRNHQIRSRKLQSVCRIKATHERLMRRQTQREIITNHGAPAAQVNPEEEANIRIAAFLVIRRLALLNCVVYIYLQMFWPFIGPARLRIL